GRVHRDADGILIGEGTGVVVLKRLADAERDGDRVYAVIRGTGVASDGRTAGLVNPDPGGQAHAVRQAWRAAGLDPAAPHSVGLLEAHGTATPAGDTAELTTLAEVFGPDGTNGLSGERAVLGSVKSMIGHTMPAAGIAGLVKAALALHHATLLPTLHCDDPHPALAATRFRTLDRAEPWRTTREQPVRRAGVNAFGFGGINAHVVLEEAPGRRPAAVGLGAGDTGSRAGEATGPRSTEAIGPRAAQVTEVSEPERILLLAADTPDRLAALLAADDSTVLAAGLAPEGTHPEAGAVRLGIVDPTAKRLALARRAIGKGRAWQGRNDVWFRPAPLLRTGGLAFVFPGLEGEFTPRVDDIAAHFGLPTVAGPVAQDVRVGDVGRHGFGVVGVGRLLDTALRRMGVVPDAVAGHSVGEWTAMAVAGLYSGAQVDAFMGEFDPDAVTVPGLAFAAIGAPADRVLAALDDDWADAGIVLSHDNAPGQSMVCGPDRAVEGFVRAFRADGVLCQVLPFRSGFHTPMLEPYLTPIKEAAERFRLHRPTVPVWSGTTAAPFPEAESAVRELFVRHLLEPVRFRQLIEALYTAGHRTFVQTGPGQLASLIGDILGDRDHLAVAANSAHRSGMAQLRRVATALWTAGAAVAPAVPAAANGTTTAVRHRPPVRLDLGGALVSLDGPVLAALRAELGGGARGTATPVPRHAVAGPSPLDDLAVRIPAAAELSALLRDTADTAAAVLGAIRTTSAAPARTTPAAPAAMPVPLAAMPVPPDMAAVPPDMAAAPSAVSSWPPATSSRTPTTPPGPRPHVPAAAAAPPPRATTLRVSPETMPHLLDHCFFPQRPDWPDVEDRWPVVPATTIVRHMTDAAEAATGLRAVAVHRARFDRWLTATPAVDVHRAHGRDADRRTTGHDHPPPGRDHGHFARGLCHPLRGGDMTGHHQQVRDSEHLRAETPGVGQHSQSQ
ncbi:acyltransferase domain-containing protein, partial [Streptomyces sp. NPDC005921]